MQLCNQQEAESHQSRGKILLLSLSKIISVYSLVVLAVCILLLDLEKLILTVSSAVSESLTRNVLMACKLSVFRSRQHNERCYKV